ncbi:MAG: putative membrane protein YhhN [Arenicella sp.]|jgi:uncharacterized membrane protein YhhN
MFAMFFLYGLVFISAMVSVYCQLNQLDGLFIVFKPLTTILIIAALLIWGNRRVPRYLVTLLLALGACLFGDVFLLNDDYFVYGLVSFLIGHLLFCYAFVSLGGFKFYLTPLFILVGVALSFYLYLLPSLGSFAVPVAIYNSVIVLMAWQGVNLLIWNKSFFTGCIALAAVLFMISDSVIAINKFIVPFSWSSAIVLPLYWLSISMLSYSGIAIKDSQLTKISN